MCKIFTILNNRNYPFSKILEEQIQGVFRKIKQEDILVDMAFNNINKQSSNEEVEQPIKGENIILLCNGEIYNSQELYYYMNVIPNEKNSCEVIIPLYKKYGIEQTLQMIDGVYSFILIDQQQFISKGISKIYIASDSYGLRPLFLLRPNINNEFKNIVPIYCISTEEQVLNNISVLLNSPGELDKSKKPNNESSSICSSSPLRNSFSQFSSFIKINKKNKKETNNYIVEKITPGTYYLFKLSDKVCSVWNIDKEKVPFNVLGGYFKYQNISGYNEIDYIKKNIQNNLIQAVDKRCEYIENINKIGCIVTDDYESLLIAGLITEYYNKKGYGQLETFSIVYNNNKEEYKSSNDLSDYLSYYLDTLHTEIIIKEQDLVIAIPELIEILGSKEEELICANISYYLISKKIKEQNKNIEYIFTSIGADEVLGKKVKANDEIEIDMECREKLKNLHNGQLLHSFNMFFNNGIILETPYLDRNFVQYYISLSPAYRCSLNEKFKDIIDDIKISYNNILKEVFNRENYTGISRIQFLPTPEESNEINEYNDCIFENNELINKFIKKYLEEIK